MDEQRKYALLFAATILAARKLNDIGSTAWAKQQAIAEAVSNAEMILSKIEQRIDKP